MMVNSEEKMKWGIPYGGTPLSLEGFVRENPIFKWMMTFFEDS